MAVICERFGINDICPAEVKVADTRILIDEREALMAPSHRPWASLDGLSPLGVQVDGWTPRDAENEFLARLRDLTR